MKDLFNGILLVGFPFIVAWGAWLLIGWLG